MMIKVPLAMEGLESEEIEIISNVFKSGQHTMSDEVEGFEKMFSEYIGSKHAVMVNSGSSANLLSFEVLVRGIGAKKFPTGSMVAVPAVLWPTTLWPAIQSGFRVILIDTKENSLEMDLDALVAAKEFHGEKLVGAIVIHPLGKSLDLQKVEDIRKRYDIFIIEDTCESLGAGDASRAAGAIGDFGTFSFYFSHHITTVEGGMVVTNDDGYADDLRSMRAHGWTRNRRDKGKILKQNPNLQSDFLFVTSGFNFRPMEFQAAVGKSQLGKIESFLKRRIENARLISQATINSPIRVIAADAETLNEKPVGAKYRSHSWMAIPIKICDPTVDLEKMTASLNNRGISTRPLLAGDFMNQPAGIHSDILKFDNLDNSKNLYKKSFMIGNHHNFTDEQVNHLVKVIEGL